MAKIKFITIIGSFIFLFFSAQGQEKGSVEVVKDPLIDSLIKRRIELTKGVSESGTPLVVHGYRVQIFFGPNRKEAYDKQAYFKSLYPEHATYISYTQPNYRLKIGDFRTRAEADKMLRELRPLFPVIFVFNEIVNPEKSN